MNNLSSTLANRFQQFENRQEKPVRLHTQTQIEAFDTAEMLGVDKKQKDLKILFRLAKNNFSVFSRTKLFMYGLKKDGYTNKVNMPYFLAMYKIFNKEYKERNK